LIAGIREYSLSLSKERFMPMPFSPNAFRSQWEEETERERERERERNRES
jgi:hypothetical protein